MLFMALLKCVIPVLESSMTLIIGNILSSHYRFLMIENVLSSYYRFLMIGNVLSSYCRFFMRDKGDWMKLLS
jgi:hypothetical protein